MARVSRLFLFLKTIIRLTYILATYQVSHCRLTSHYCAFIFLPMSFYSLSFETNDPDPVNPLAGVFLYSWYHIMIWLTSILLGCSQFHRLMSLLDHICRGTPTLAYQLWSTVVFRWAICWPPVMCHSGPAAVPLSQLRSFSSVFGDVEGAQLCLTYLPLDSQAFLWTPTVFT